MSTIITNALKACDYEIAVYMALKETANRVESLSCGQDKFRCNTDKAFDLVQPELSKDQFEIYTVSLVAKNKILFDKSKVWLV